jgi:hypothetical protein
MLVRRASDVLTIELSRKAARRVHTYLIAYLIFEADVHRLSEEEQQQLSTQAMTKSKIEQMKKKVRTHRVAVNFDAGFCNMQVTHT